MERLGGRSSLGPVIACLVAGLAGCGPEAKGQRIFIRNAALVVTMDPALGSGSSGVIEYGDVLLDGEVISAVGKNLPVPPDASVLDATDRIVMPGFVDVHNHLWQSLIRGCGADQDPATRQRDCIAPMRSGDVIREVDVHAGVRLSTLELISTGVTTVVDDSHSFTPEFVRGNLKALSESGLRFVYAYCGRAAGVEDIRAVKEQLIDPAPLATLQLCAHPSPAGLDDLEAMSALAKELGVTLNVHLLEDEAQRAEEPLRLLEEAGALDSRLLANHAIHLTDAEIATLAQRGVRVAHSPASDMRTASGIAPVPKMHAAGIDLGLGLDGASASSDAFVNMRAAIGLQRVGSLDPAVYPTVPDVLRLATLGGAEVLGMEKEIGSLTPGKQADLIVLDPKRVNFAPRWDWLGQLVFNGQPANVETVFVKGRLLKYRGRLTNVDASRVVFDAERAAARVRGRLGR